MKIDNDTTGIEQAERDLMRAKSYRPYAEWFAVKINGEWCLFDQARKITREIAKAETLCPQILQAQKPNAAVYRRIKELITR